MREICRLLKSRHVPVQIPHIPMQYWVIVSDHPQITLHVLYIDSIKPNKTRKDECVTLGKFIAEEIWPARLMEVFLKLVQCSKRHDDVLIVSCLCGVEPRLVYAGDEVSVQPRIKCVDVRFQMVRT